MFLRKHRAQSVLEYAWLLAIIAASVIAMRVYFQRALQGKIKSLADQISPAQYNPTNKDTWSESNTNTTGSGRYEMKAMESYVEGEETTERTFKDHSKGDVIE
jgi:Flp pilus assembly pilin Flp